MSNETDEIKINKDPSIRALLPREKDYRVSDAVVGGLSLLVKVSGAKRWVFTYRFNGKQNRLGFGYTLK